MSTKQIQKEFLGIVYGCKLFRVSGKQTIYRAVRIDKTNISFNKNDLNELITRIMRYDLTSRKLARFTS